jgi:hypothetical protein
MSVSHASDNFAWQEFACHDGTEVPLEAQPNVRRLCLTVLEPIREKWRGPIIVVSGWRSRAWNDRVGGAHMSRHCTGEAADIRPVSMSQVDPLRGLIEDMIRRGELPGIGGVGAYRGWVHVDCRPKPKGGHIARWMGRGVGSEETA